jgi:hypothetical protein
MSGFSLASLQVASSRRPVHVTGISFPYTNDGIITWLQTVSPEKQKDELSERPGKN